MLLFQYLFFNILLLLGTIIIAFFWLLDSTVSAVFSFILLYIVTSIALFILNIEFLGLLLIMVYVGGIAVLFIFVSITLGGRTLTENIYVEKKNPAFSIYILSFFLFKIIYICDFLNAWGFDVSYKISLLGETSLFYNYLYFFSDIHLISTLLYTEFNFYVIILGIILL